MDGRRSPNSTLSLVIPAFNEAEGINRAVAEAVAALARFAHSFEVIVVDDGSNDGTAAAVADLAKADPRIHLLKHDRNQGYGAALRTGFEAARYSFVAFTDADCQFDLSDLEPLLELATQHGIAVGYRQDRKDSLCRRIYSRGYNQLVRLLFGTGVRDCDCALKVFRRDLLAQILPTTTGFFVNTEMLTRARQLGVEAAERAVLHRPRLQGTSKVSVLEIPRVLARLVPFWWSQLLFPAMPADETRPVANGRRLPGWEFWIVLATACLVFFSRLHLPLQEPEESRYAEIPRQMLATGSLAVPVLHGQPYFDKPPLLYWLVMGSYQAFGVHDWAARLIMSLAGLGTVLITFFWGTYAFNRRTGLAAALILCLGARFVYLERLVTMNGLLALWATGALAAAYFALSNPRFRRTCWILAACSGALGFLTKGPVALVLFAPVLLWTYLEPRAVRPRMRDWRLFALIIAGIAGPWFLIAACKDPEFLSYFFWKHHVVRFVAPFDHAKPPWYYTSDLVLGLFPGSTLLGPMLLLIFKRYGPEAARRPAALGYVLLAAVCCFGFFSVAGSKRAGYILPLLPLLALACGATLDLLLGSMQASVVARCGNLGRQLAQTTWGATAICSIVAMNWNLLAIVPGVVILLTCILALACGQGILRKLTPSGAWAACALTMLVLVVAGAQLILPSYAKRFAMRNQVRGQLIAAQDQKIPVVCYPRGWDSVSFYLGRNDVRVYTREQRGLLVADLAQEPRTLAFVKAGQPLAEFLRALPRTLEFIEQGRRGEVAVGWVRPKPVLPELLVTGVR